MLGMMDNHPHSLYIEPWEITDFYVKRRDAPAPGRPPLCSYWVLREDVAQWLKNFHGLLDSDRIFQPVVHRWDLYCGYQLKFHTRQDLIMFKLTWIGAL